MRLEMKDEVVVRDHFSGSSGRGGGREPTWQQPCPVGEASGVTKLWGGKPAKADPLPFRLMSSLPTPQSPGLGFLTADGPAAGLTCA
jgi:hypothetical protein